MLGGDGIVYYQEGSLLIRSMTEPDIDAFFEEFSLQGWEKPKELFKKYLDYQDNKTRAVVVAEKDGSVAGYATLIYSAKTGPFKNKHLPEISDFNVLEKYQRGGIGNKIMDVLEAIVKEKSPIITLAAGLYEGYGTAQRMYVKRGYIPDGSGVWYGDSRVTPGQKLPVDDALVLYFLKPL